MRERTKPNTATPAFLVVTAWVAVTWTVGMALPPAAAADQYFAFIPGIEGDSTTAGHENWITLDSAGFKVDHATAAPASSRRRGDVVLEDITCTKSMDRASPKLAQACADGKNFDDVVIHLCTDSPAGTPPACYLQYELKNAIVSSYSLSSGDDGTVESFALNYRKVALTYLQEGPPAPTVEFEDDHPGQGRGR